MQKYIKEIVNEEKKIGGFLLVWFGTHAGFNIIPIKQCLIFVSSYSIVAVLTTHSLLKKTDKV